MIAIIAVLMAILIPVLFQANAAARSSVCAGNIRQIAQGMMIYANNNRGQFPPGISSPKAQYWSDWERLGRILTPQLSEFKGPIAVCPDDSSAVRSYSMNIWACSDIPAILRTAGIGTLWKISTPGSSRLILITESWSSDGVATGGFVSPPNIGMRGNSPGARFGGGVGLNPLYNAKRWGMVNTELAFNRHRKVRSRTGPTQPVGRLHIGYADGHVALKSNTDLVSPATGLSTLDSLWSRLDYDLNK